MTDAPTPLEDAAEDLVIQAARLVRAVRRLEGDLPPAGLRTLSVLDEHGPMAVTRLAELDRTSQPAASTLVKGLVARGWVATRPDPADGRSRLVDMTAEGRAVLADVRRRNARAVAARLADHDAADLHTAARLLREVLVTDLADPTQEGTS
ncbi:MarR family transcriptional regulator [uncultured Nocardioides sp.]|uniref:MarR family winged helix-turn-helix transcriptional regulator n=1 Tax=uncultured Nocardioides sp. TaxID=198441 RepID=UPI00260B94B0|nr:MarR family transcriptional regulator [uncultured Nocardioides sp.]